MHCRRGNIGSLEQCLYPMRMLSIARHWYVNGYSIFIFISLRFLRRKQNKFVRFQEQNFDVQTGCGWLKLTSKENVRSIKYELLTANIGSSWKTIQDVRTTHEKTLNISTPLNKWLTPNAFWTNSKVWYYRCSSTSRPRCVYLRSYCLLKYQPFHPGSLSRKVFFNKGFSFTVPLMSVSLNFTSVTFQVFVWSFLPTAIFYDFYRCSNVCK